MQGYDNSSYGDAFADVYDEWYGAITDADATAATIADLAASASSADDAAGSPIVELGVGTGRLALPLEPLVRPRRVIGIDSSHAMLDALAAKAPDHRLQLIRGDMIDAIPDGPLGVVFVAFNTFFNLASAERQQACMTTIAARLSPGGCFVIEALVPDEPPLSGSQVEVRSITADRVVLSVSRFGDQLAEGQFVEFTETGGVRLRPWSVRFVAPAELDQMAARAGLQVRHRWRSFDRDPFDDDSDQHVTVYERRADG